MGNCCNSYKNPCSKDPVRGHSFEWRGPWKEGAYYYNDDYVTDFVSYKNVILACKRNHLSDANVEPVLIYDGDNPVDVDSQYWSFVLCSVSADDWDDLKFKIDGDFLSYSTDGGETWIEIGQVSIPIVDHLNSSASDQALSANQGRILDGKISDVSNRVSTIEGSYLTTETDPIFSASSAASISASDIQNWNSKTSNVGTVTGVKLNNTTKNPDSNGVVDLGTVVTSETDPTVPSWVKAITQQDINNWNDGSVEETDPVFTSSPAYNISNADIESWNNKVSNVQSDWNATSGLAKILNKPTIPTKVSDLQNDSGFLTSETDPIFSASAAKNITSSDISNWNGKQDALVSGTNIKTINGNSILGSGNLEISGGGGTVGSLNSTNTTAQSTSASESFSGTINLHKVSKTGSYNDLLNKPTIPAAITSLNDIPGVTISSPSNNQVLLYNGSGWVNATSPGGGNMNYIRCTQVEYDNMQSAGTLQSNVLYVIVDTAQNNG